MGLLMEGGSLRYDDTGLKRLGALFAGSPKIVRVGILSGPKMTRKKKTDPKSNLTNAEIGAIHEYGQKTHVEGGRPKAGGIPIRSFIYKPLSSPKARKHIVKDAAEGLDRELTRGQAVDAEKSFYGKIGAGMVAVIHDAFDAQGPGWTALSEVTKDRRKKRKIFPRMGERILEDLGELRHSISFRVMGGS
jgi:phage gpG-like protein